MAACRPTKQSMACQQRRVPSSARGREPRLGLLQKGIRDWRRHASNGRPGQPPFDRLTPQCGLRGRNGILHLLVRAFLVPLCGSALALGGTPRLGPLPKEEGSRAMARPNGRIHRWGRHESTGGPDKRLAQFQRLAVVSEQAHSLGIADDPRVQRLLRLATTDIRGGQVAERALSRLERHLRGPYIASQLHPPTHSNWPNIREGVLIGYCVHTRRPILVPWEHFCKHVVCLAPTGAGKTLTVFLALSQFRRNGVDVRFFDAKGETSRLTGLFPDIAIFRIGQFPFNILDPGDGAVDLTTFFRPRVNEISRLLLVHRPTAFRMEEFLVEAAEGNETGDLPMSLDDAARTADVQAKRARDPQLATVSRALSTLARDTGEFGRVRRGPGFAGLPLVAYDLREVPPATQHFLLGIELVTVRDAMARRGRTSDRLERVIFFDEGGNIVGKDLSRDTTSYVSAVKRAVRESRSTGTCLWTNYQGARDLDPSVPENAGTVVVLGARSREDVKAACQLLDWPEEDASFLASLRPGMAVLRCPDICPHPQVVRIPLFRAGPYASERQVASHMAPLLKELRRRTVYAPSARRQPFRYREVLGEVVTPTGNEEGSPSPGVDYAEHEPAVLAEWYELLTEILAHPEAGVKEHYQRAGLSAGKGTRLKNALLGSALITVRRGVSPQGGRPREVLALTERGQEFVDGYETHQQQREAGS